MNRLGQFIADEIRSSGPISVARYMELCLLHPDYGYYTTRDPFGSAGDFITAPEISQIFGELLGLFLAQAWIDQGAPQRFALSEIGPGRGTLMADAMRAMRVVPGMADAAEPYLIEASPHLRSMQQDRLGNVTHLDTVADLPEAPLFLIANEFLDALPIHQFQKGPDGWAERLIGLQDGGLSFGLGPVMPLDLLGPEGCVIERCPTAVNVVDEIAARIAAHGGVALLVDYGGWNGQGDTFQALADHRSVDPLANPGAADLTAHVDFAPLASAARARGCAVGYTTQGALLQALGIEARASRLSAAGDKGVAMAARRLTHETEMGQLFKALAIWPETAPPPAGFLAMRGAEAVMPADRPTAHTETGR
ncbi:class I SAM-dependent methyltransferase [Paracoccus aurantiacus]|uniref:Class I SAM-dependent methyltransferase n=1 Tax=Paracoccus aurantiacus TaxID=2599412 RepID=A0A5C6S2N8_9RHOB|nr:SAM-dependent methyltransferase [Paracoccus aurantiacus]TXB68526.1 class I SAM-dependent methyltransferase [Paracoccus aurantiacus]